MGYISFLTVLLIRWFVNWVLFPSLNDAFICEVFFDTLINQRLINHFCVSGSIIYIFLSLLPNHLFSSVPFLEFPFKESINYTIPFYPIKACGKVIPLAYQVVWVIIYLLDKTLFDCHNEIDFSGTDFVQFWGNVY